MARAVEAQLKQRACFAQSVSLNSVLARAAVQMTDCWQVSHHTCIEPASAFRPRIRADMLELVAVLDGSAITWMAFRRMDGASPSIWRPELPPGCAEVLASSLLSGCIRNHSPVTELLDALLAGRCFPALKLWSTAAGAIAVWLLLHEAQQSLQH
jgi:hypothetical protein